MSALRKMFHTERVHQVGLFLLLLASYMYVFPRWADPNQNSRLDMVVAVVEDGTFQIDPYVWNTVDYAKVGEHYDSDKAPGTAFLGIPIYAGLKVFLDLPLTERLIDSLSRNEAFQSTLRAEGSGILEQKVRFAIAQVVLTVFISGLPTALLGVLIYRVAGRFTPRPGPRLAAALGYGLLTPAFAYAGALYGHQLSAALLFGAFALVFLNWHNLGVVPLLLLGILLGYSVLTEYPTVLVAGLLFVYAAYRLYQAGRLPAIIYPALSGGLLGLALMAYNNAVFGGPFELGYSYSELWVDQHQTGFMSLSAPRLQAVWGITFGSFRGLFYYSPFMLLALPGFYAWWHSNLHRAAFWVAALVSALIFLFNASSIMWWGGFAVGPRYLLPALPFMAIPIALAFDRWGKLLAFRALAGFLAAWSFVATWGLTLAEQSFPSDSIYNPLLEYALPNWQAGNVARNLGTIIGLPGVWSLLPLGLLLLVILAVWMLVASRYSEGVYLERNALQIEME